MKTKLSFLPILDIFVYKKKVQINTILSTEKVDGCGENIRNVCIN